MLCTFASQYCQQLRSDFCGLVHISDVLFPSTRELQETESQIPDINQVDPNYRQAVIVCYYFKILTETNASGTFSGKGTLNRTQAATIYCRTSNILDALDSFEPSEPEPEFPIDENWGTTTPETPAQSTGDTTFAMKNGENVQQMMDRINAATPAYRASYLTNGQPINDANIQAMLAEFQKTMPAGTTWDTNVRYDYHSPKIGNGGGCLSFGSSISDAIFGEDCPVTQHQNYDNIKIGDIIWLKTATDDGHVYVVTSNPDSLGYYNACDGNSDGAVWWTSFSNVKDLKGNPAYAQNSITYSRY